MAERAPYARASYEAVATTPRPPVPPTTTGLPRSEGLSRCSTAAKKASRSRCRMLGSRRTPSMMPGDDDRVVEQSAWARMSTHDPGHSAAYVERFRRLAAQGVDLVGEARLVD